MAASVALALIFPAAAAEPSSAASFATVTTTSPGWSVTLTVNKQSVRAGLSIAATLIITNKTGHPATVYCCAANGVYAIEVENSRIPNGPVTGAVGCRSTLRPGRNVFHSRVRTDYESCSESTPPCPRPLPADVYHTVMNWPGFSARVPRPGTLHVRVTQ